MTQPDHLQTPPVRRAPGLTLTPTGRCATCNGQIARADSYDLESGAVYSLTCRSCSRSRVVGIADPYRPCRPIKPAAPTGRRVAGQARRGRIAELVERGLSNREIVASTPDDFRGIARQNSIANLIREVRQSVAAQQAADNREKTKLRMRGVIGARRAAELCTYCGKCAPAPERNTCLECFGKIWATRNKNRSPVARLARGPQRSWKASRVVRDVIKTALIEGLLSREIVALWPDLLPGGFCRRTSAFVAKCRHELRVELGVPITRSP